MKRMSGKIQIRKIYLQHLKLTKGKYTGYKKNINIAIKVKRKLWAGSLQRMILELSIHTNYKCYTS